MKITAIETLRPKAHPNLIWVQVHTDEGLTGLGETWFGADAVEADIHGRIAPLLLNRDPDPATLWSVMRPYVGFAGTGAEMRACSALDVALWDLKGQAEGKPIHELLGGAVRESIRVYNTCAGPDYVSQTAEVRPDNFGVSEENALEGRRFEDLDAFMNRPAELAAELLEMGISSMKIWPFDFAEGAARGLDISTADLNRALEPFEKIRAAHGGKMRLKAELHGLWDLPAAKKIAAALAPLDIDWIEDPVWMDQMDMIAEFVGSTDITVAGGETLGGRGAFEILMGAGLDVPIMDVTWGGGVTTARQVASFAESGGQTVAFHDCSGPVTLAASVHLALACPNVQEQEITRGFYYGWYHELVDRPPPLEDGMIRAPEGPGLGLALNDALLAREDVMRRVSAP